ncbi:non-ribosomal peptide synthetase [uncultured Kordia sp.]|uniref:non-ribosomal peptide synthetase n=1 Tax=uncultured Kordia sp. TaxID=507699 RepID=UPI00261488DF|nr:non-ribosomal peptide synthetase [uncultured Kordia sp.]
MNIHKLIDQLIKAGIKFQIVEDNLKFLIPKGGIDAELIKELKLYKDEVIAFIKNSHQRNEHEEIVSVEEQEYYGLSHGQQRLWMLDQLSEENKTAYNVSSAWRIKQLKREPFEKAISEIVKRHEILRTNFVVNKGKPKQKIHDYNTFNFKIKYTNLKDVENKEAQITNTLENEGNFMFNLEKDHLLRTSLLELDDNDFVFVISMHHIITDGWSLDIFFAELLLLYKTFLNEKNSPLKPLQIQYKDFASWQNNQLSEGKLDVHKSYWLNKLNNTLPVLQLPLDFPRPTEKTFEGKSVYFELDVDTTTKIHELTKQEGVTLFMFLTAVVNTLLYKYTKQKDIIIGTPIAGRNHPELESQIGLYINTLVFRTFISEEETFESLLHKIKSDALEAFKFQNYPFDSLIEDLNIPRDSSRSAFFDVIVALQNTTGTDPELLEGLSVDLLTVENNTSKFDLSFEFFEDELTISGNLEYSTDIFSQERILQMINHFKTIISNILKTPTSLLKNIEFIHEEEKNLLLHEFNKTAAPYSLTHTIQEVFEEQVAKNPEALAVSFEGKTLTYQELNKKSNQLAHFLRETYTIKSDDLIGVMMDRSEWMVITMLGIIKSGAAYVPIDPEYPKERIDYIVSDSKVAMLMVDSGKTEETYPCATLSFQELTTSLANYSTNNPINTNKPSDLVYVIYTSGTTGKPKGVMIAHKSLLNLCSWHQEYYEVTSTSKATLYAKTGFDASVWETWPYLLVGSCLYPITHQQSLNIAELGSILVKNEITHSFLPTVVCEQLLSNNAIPSDMMILTGGDKLQKLPDASVNIINNYGPTESTVVATSIKLREHSGKTIPIGKPIANTQIYILDDTLQLQPIGVGGEICIGGNGISRGYLNREKLTEEKFIENPFNKGEKLYKTGDIGKWTLDGNIEFIGRKDTQVKIRGYRIELGEIENALQKLQGIEKAIVLVKLDKNEQKLLVAYLQKGKDYKELDFRTELGEFLPIYMIPSNFVTLEEFPLTANGKINREALIALKDTHFSISETNSYLAPHTEEEKKMVALWEEVLKVDRIGVKDNFFELGGHSILATLIMFGVYEKFGVKILLRNVFSNPTIENLCEFISTKEKETINKIEALEKSEYYEVSYGQKRLWILNQFKEAQAAYIVPNVWEMEGLEENLVQEAFLKLIERHEILRTTFLVVNNEIKQKIHEAKDVPFHVEHVDLRGVEAQKEKSLALVKKEFNNIFDLEKSPLFRVVLMQLTDTKHVFVLTLHHIISDGWSLSILTEEFLTIYNDLKNNKETLLPPLRIQYKDYAFWHNRQLEGEQMKQSKEYLQEMFKGELPVLELPTDYHRPKVQTYKGSVVEFAFDTEVTKNLRTICKEQEVTMFMLILTTVHVLLHKYTGQTDFIIGTPVAGREEKELENQIGFYINNIAMRNQIHPTKSFQELLLNIKQTTLKAFENQSYPFDMLLNDLKIDRSLSRSPLFDVVVANLDNFHGNTTVKDDNDDLKVALFEMDDEDFSKQDLRIGYAEYENTVVLNLRYSTDLFKEESIHAMKETLQRIVNDIIKDINIRVEACDTHILQETIAPKQQTFKSNFSF